MPEIYGSLPAFAELYILKSYRRKNVNDFFRTDRTALKRNFLHLNGKLRAALLRGLFCLNEKAEEAVAPPAEVYPDYHLFRMRIFPLPRIKRILFRPVFLFYPRRAFFPAPPSGLSEARFYSVTISGSFRFTRSFIAFSFARLSLFLSLKFYRALIRAARSFAFAAFFSRDTAHAQ